MKTELVFIPVPGAGHLASTVEMAKLLVDRDERLSITVLIIQSRFGTLSLSTASTHRLRYISLPLPDPQDNVSQGLFEYMESQKPHVREAVAKLLNGPESPRILGFVVDLFCIGMIDVANEFGVPSYVFYTCNAGFLGLQYHLQFLRDEKNLDVTTLKDTDTELSVPFLTHPYPVKCFPSVMLNKEWNKMFQEQARRLGDTKGILVNTFAELEPCVLKFLADGNGPPVYPVGPILNLNADGQGGSATANEKRLEIMSWLDDQPPKSVVFLCFGSMGGFEEDQVREMAHALERSGHRFLWSLRRGLSMGDVSAPREYTSFEEVLPEGFLDRTANSGKVIGWAPQVAVLAHPSVGGFVSHCGWNSVLESLWFGVPIAAWPLYAEQKLNAFEMVVELGLAVEIKMDYQNDFLLEMAAEVVKAEDIERGIKCLMDPDNEVRTRVKEISEKCRVARMEDGSSFVALGRFIQDVFDNVP